MREYRHGDRIPGRHCAGCSQILFADDDACIECGALRPVDGWPSLRESFDPWLGRVLEGRYVVTRRIGQGAMSKVYRARSRAIPRRFAVKIIDAREAPKGVGAEEVHARLRRELAATCGLRNPHVVPPYEVLQPSQHLVAVVMDYVDGVTLHDEVKAGGPLAVRRAVRIMKQVANGVHEAHEAGMIHRDLKPANIMVERLPAGDDFAHVLDFGIVRIDDGVSMTNGFVGTPLFASPEQATTGVVDRRSDIYSLGATLFFVLTGAPPFLHSNTHAILQSHVRRPPPTLAEATAGHSFGPRLEALVADMLAKAQSDRPDTLAEVIERLDGVLREDDFGRAASRKSVELMPEDLDTGPAMAELRESPGLGAASSVFESSERDDTGPKAAIFRRSASREKIRQWFEDSED